MFFDRSSGRGCTGWKSEKYLGQVTGAIAFSQVSSVQHGEVLEEIKKFLPGIYREFT
jgi:hypothetical protein